jgi:hypothetical protein
LVTVAPAGAGDSRSLAGSAEKTGLPLLLVSPPGVAKSRYVMPVSASSGEGARDFAAAYEAKYGSAPDSVNSQGYNAALLARQALSIAPVPRDELFSRLGALPSPLAQVPAGSTGPAASPANRDAAGGA